MKISTDRTLQFSENGQEVYLPEGTHIEKTAYSIKAVTTDGARFELIIKHLFVELITWSACNEKSVYCWSNLNNAKLELKYTGLVVNFNRNIKLTANLNSLTANKLVCHLYSEDGYLFKTEKSAPTFDIKRKKRKAKGLAPLPNYADLNPEFAYA